MKFKKWKLLSDINPFVYLLKINWNWSNLIGHRKINLKFLITATKNYTYLIPNAYYVHIYLYFSSFSNVLSFLSILERDIQITHNCYIPYKQQKVKCHHYLWSYTLRYTHHIHSNQPQYSQHVEISKYCCEYACLEVIYTQ